MARKAKRADSAQPWVDNYQELAEWLKKHEAVCLQQLAVGDDGRPSAYLEKWQIGHRKFLIEVLDAGRGWEIYTATDTIEIFPSLEDAERRLGL